LFTTFFVFAAAYLIHIYMFGPSLVIHTQTVMSLPSNQKEKRKIVRSRLEEFL
jgi:hypothetical protein